MRLCIILIFLGLFQAIPFYTSSMAAPVGYSDQGERIVVKGRVACLNASGHRPNDLAECADPSHGFGLAASDGEFYKFLQDDPSAAIFTDPLIRQRELQVTARPHPGNRLEVVQVRSIRDGKLYDIFYFCEVCNITAYAPGPCTCCRQPFEFRETPARVD